MAHELTVREDGKVEMAWIGEKPWHGLGVEMRPDATIEEWKHSAGMDWDVESSRVVFRARGSNKVCVIDDSVVLHRSDNDAPLGPVREQPTRGGWPVEPGFSTEAANGNVAG